MREILVTLICLGAMPLSFKKPFVGLLFFSVLAYMRLQDLAWGFARDQRWSFYIAIMTFAGYLLSKEKNPPMVNWRTTIMVLLVVVVGTGHLLLAEGREAADVTRFADYVKIIGIAIFTTAVVRSREQLRILIWVIAMCFAFYGVKAGVAGIVKLGDVYIKRGPGGMIEAYRAGWAKAGALVEGDLFSKFDFGPQPSGDIAALYQAFGINANNPAADLAGPKGRCATAAQALVNGLSRAVSLRINPQSIDTHFDNWQTSHVQSIRPCFAAIASLIQFLKSKSFWDRTTLVISSEFARTPKLNNQNGRDHHLCNSIVLAGNGIKGNQVIGASGQDSYDVVPFDFDSQAPDETAPSPIVPADVHATICKAMDVSYDHIENQEPRLLTKALSETS